MTNTQTDSCDKPSCSASSNATVSSPSNEFEHGTRFKIETMDCAAEESEIRRALEPIVGIQSLRFQLTARTLDIDAASEIIQEAVTAIRRAGFDPQPIVAPKTASSTSNNPSEIRDGIPRLVLALMLAIAAEGLSFFAKPGLAVTLIEMALAATAIGLSGLTTYKKGFAALRHARLNINALMSVAATGAFLIGQWPEAAMVMALYAIAEVIEARSVDRARNAIASLMALAPEQAYVRQTGGTWKSALATEVLLDAVVRIRPGERVPLDGVITSGSSAINQAPVTGESIPVEKTVGDTVFAGTINETAEIEFRVTAVANNTTLARIIHAVEQAQGLRAPTQRFVDRFAAIYTPSVFVLAVAVAVSMPFLMGWTWMASLYKALVLLVVACPCALVISTPVTVVSALASAARRGILIKGGTYLEEARKLNVIAFDKTGTVTEGKPQLVEYAALNPSTDKSRVALIAASLAMRSDHPVSKAIAAGLKVEAIAVSEFKALAGRGVQGTIEGNSYTLANHRFIEECNLCSAELEAQLKIHEEAGRTVTLLASTSEVLGMFAVADTIKPSSQQAISELKSMAIKTVMLTGDNKATAKSIAEQAGIDDARGDLLPDNKLDAIQDMQRWHGLTAMTGDGINDAPALAKADIGIAMGGAGTDTAMEAADIVIMNDDLRRIPETIRLSKNTHAVLWQNITLALGIKAVFLALTIFGSTTMWMAVFADMGASLLVVGNGLRLLRK
jgi:Zn2+/Cd2+-exporting ATPase